MKSRSVLFLSAAMIALPVLSVHAQTVAPNAQPAPVADTQIEEVVVTAQKRTERLQDVPSTVNVVQGAALQKYNLFNFTDVAVLTPGVSMTEQNPLSQAITVRGVGFDPSSGSDPAADVYFNEAPLDASSAFRALYDIGQIEVLRGPQGTLRGRTSPAGAITIASNKPRFDEFSGSIQQSLSDQDLRNTQAVINAPLVEGKLALRVAGLYDENNAGGSENYYTGRESSSKTKSLRGSLAWRATDRINAVLTQQHLDNKIHSEEVMYTLPGVASDPVLTPGDRTALRDGPADVRYKGDITTLNLDWDLGAASLTYLGGYRKTTLTREGNLELTRTIPGYQRVQTLSTKNEVQSNELRLASTGERTWNFLFGAYYADNKSTTLVDLPQVIGGGFGATPALPNPLFIIDVGIDQAATSKDFAVFTDHRFKVTSKDTLELGLRWQRQTYDRSFALGVSGPLLGPDPIITEPLLPDFRKGAYEAMTGQLSFRHEFNRGLTGYATYATSYRPGGQMTSTAPLSSDLLTFDEEKSKSYEVGLKGALFDRRVRYTASAYLQKFKGYQGFTGQYLAVSSTADGTVDNNVAFTFNGDAEVKGVEGTVDVAVMDGWNLSVSGNYSDGKFKDADAPCNDFNGDGVPDSEGTPSVPVGEQVATCRLNGPLSAQAKWSLSASSEYTRPIGGVEGFVRGILAYTPDRADPYTSTKFDAYLQTSLFLGVRSSERGWEATLFAKNLFNDDTVTQSYPQILAGGVFPSGYGNVVVVPPREVGVTLRYAFGQ